jgi:alpha-aminoadipate/glutamate carrier protein LysW
MYLTHNVTPLKYRQGIIRNQKSCANEGEEREATHMVLCPECENDLDIDEDEVEEGDMISCNECGTDFEVVTADPLELAPISEEEEEDEDEDTDEDEEE